MTLRRTIKRTGSVATAATALTLLGLSSPASGLTIEWSVGNGIKNHAESAAVTEVIRETMEDYPKFFSDSVTVRVHFDHQVAGSLGESDTDGMRYSYVEFRNRLNSRRTSYNDNLAFGSSVANQSNNPVPGAQQNSGLWITSPNARVLGLMVDNPALIDSTITFDIDSFDTSLTGTIPATKFALQDTIIHEFNEALGLGSGLDTPTSGATPQDLFRYSAPNTRSYTTSESATPYLSFDACATALVDFNQIQPPSANDFADYGDWAMSSTPRSQDAYGTPGERLGWDYVAFENLDVIGWTYVPEPSTGLLLATGLLGLAIRRRTH